MDAATLTARLRLDFTPADTGDSETNFTARLAQIASDAVARPNTTPQQQEAGARYLLIGAQIRQLTRNPERLKSASGSEIEQGLATRLAMLRTDMAWELTASGLGGVRARQGSMSIPVEAAF